MMEDLPISLSVLHGEFDVENSEIQTKFKSWSKSILFHSFALNFRAPDSAKVKSKMVYAGSKDALTRVFVGVSVKINATDLSELTEEICKDACRKFA